MPASNFMNIAHRGASSYAPENTFAAFDKALELGAAHIEFDLHFSADGHIVVIHDDTVDRTTDGSGAVSDFTLAQLRSLDAGAWFSSEYAGEAIPTLAGLLERYKGRFHFHIEIKGKTPGLSQRTADLVRGYGVIDRVTITSFDAGSLEELAPYAPELPRGWLVRELDESTVARAREMGLTLLCPRADLLTPDLVQDLHGRGFTVRAWGVADQDLMRRVVAAGADGATVNFPDKLDAYLRGL